MAAEAFLRLRNHIASAFVGRGWASDCIVAALLSGRPCLLVGPPGTGKTAIVEALTRSTGLRYFYYLLTRFTEPDEILGPLDIAALRKGVYRRVTSGRLPEADIVFLDEVFKASSSIRNALLDIILNRRFLDGTEYRRLPLLALYTASNEVSDDPDDRAFLDRLTIRCFLRYVPRDRWWDLVRAGVAMSAGRVAPAAPRIARPDVVRAQRAVAERALASLPRIRDFLLKAFAACAKAGAEVSDRRRVEMVFVASAVSIMRAHPTILADDVRDAAVMVAPSSPEEAAKISAGLEGMSSVEAVRAEVLEVLRSVKAVRELLKSGRPPQSVMDEASAVVAKALRAVSRWGEVPEAGDLIRELEEEVGKLERALAKA